MSILEYAFISCLNMSITASYAAIGVLLARLLLKKAPKVFSYALWGIVLFRLLCPFSFSSGLSLVGLLIPSHRGVPSNQYIPKDLGITAIPQVDTGLDSINVAVNGSLPAAVPTASINPLQVWITLGTVIWLAGAGILLAYALFSYLRLKRRISTATLVRDNIYETDLIRSPFVCGLLKPRIYLPLSLTGQEREYILRHEQVHLQRFDYLIKPLAFFALALHWFNPLMWLCFSLLAKDMEMSCDERVMQDSNGQEAANYSSSLLALAMPRRLPTPCPLAFGESNVKARIKNILNYRQPGFWVILASVITVLLLFIGLISNPTQGLSIYEHPGTFLGPDSLKTSAKVYIIDRAKDTEYMLTDAGEIKEITAILEDMRIPRKEISKDRSGKLDNRYSIYYYSSVEDDPADYRCIIHAAPVWIDNNVKPSFRYKLVNEQEIFQRLEAFLVKKGNRLAEKADYDIETLLENKTPYVGNNSQVVGLINALPLPGSVLRETVQLHTSKMPYGITINYRLTDDSAKTGEEQYLKNSLFLFALIDNVEEITHHGYWNNKLLSSTPFCYTYTREDADKVVGGVIRQFAKNQETLTDLVNIVQILNPKPPKTALKGLELYVWRNQELTGNNEIYYTLLPGTNRNKTAEEVYNLSQATTDLEKINRELATYEEVSVFVSHPRSISKEEMGKIADQIKIKNGTIAVGTRWFDQ